MIRKQLLLARFSGIKARVPNFRSYVKNFSSLGGVGGLYSGFSVAVIRNMAFMGLHMSLLPALQIGNLNLENAVIQYQQAK